jgi:hypothetical protein
MKIKKKMTSPTTSFLVCLMESLLRTMPVDYPATVQTVFHESEFVKLVDWVRLQSELERMSGERLFTRRKGKPEASLSKRS